jgi:hypothetical protein
LLSLSFSIPRFSPNEKAAGTIDLKTVQGISAYDKNGKADYSRLNIDIGERVFKFRASNEAEGRKWLEGLEEWRDYFLLNM